MIQNQEPVKIYVSRAGQSTRLRLRDNRNNPNLTDTDPADIDTEVDPGNTIIWELDPKSISTPPDPGFFPIGSLVSIRQTFEADGAQYRGSVPVLTAEPVKQNDGTITAQVKNPSPGKGKFANYKIVYTLPGDASELEDDPKILLNS